ncbi:MAG TPA: type VI secretion system baseplate subunit TssE [Polyangiales bacterium]|nr:type VI secretion system baseplate subunit TssE [Polyangiales bacterium]
MSGGLLAKVRRRDQRAPALSTAESILVHLSELLNARHGDSSLDPTYGLPDLTDLAHRVPEGIPVLQRSIAETIRRHEPRLARVHVATSRTEVAGPRASLHFEVQAELAGGGTLRFHTEVAPGGRVRVS